MYFWLSTEHTKASPVPASLLLHEFLMLLIFPRAFTPDSCSNIILTVNGQITGSAKKIK